MSGPRKLPTGEVSIVMGNFLGVPIIRIVMFRGLYWGPPIWGNCHIIVSPM